MDEKKLQEKIAEYYKKLTPKMQEVFSKMEWLDQLRSISLRYNMTDVQIQTLGTETSLVMLGIIHPDEYEQILMNELAVPRDVGLKIIDDINLEVLKDWKGELSETYDKNIKDIGDSVYGEGKTLDARFASLPKEVQEAIVDTGYQEKLLEIGKKYNLNLEQLGALDVTTTKMMLGTIHPEEYNSKLSIALEMPKEKSDIVANEVNNEIMKGIRTSLINHTESTRKVEQPEPKVPIPPYKKMELQNSILEIPKTSTPNPNYTAINIDESLNTPAVKENILMTAGIDVMPERTNALSEANNKLMTDESANNDANSLSKSGINLINETPKADIVPASTRSQAMAGIENPPINIPKNIMAAKLGGIVSNNIGGSGAPHSEDRYRESI